MTIEIFEDKIVFGNGHTISESPDKGGLTVNSNFYFKKFNYFKSDFQGEVSGYTSGGYAPPYPPGNSNTIDKFPFATESDATDVGNLAVARGYVAGQSSSESGYTSGGRTLGPGFTVYNTIDKFPFSAPFTTATDAGDLFESRFDPIGQSSTDHGYTSGGVGSPSNPGYKYTIDKFPFSASFTTATDVGDLYIQTLNAAGQSSSESGYVSGGQAGPFATATNVIHKFPFASDADGTFVGYLTQSRYGVSGHSSITHGYTSGGDYVIDKFPFASDADATDVGDLQAQSREQAEQSSVEYGYLSGGVPKPASGRITIDKFPFITDANATSVGDLTQGRSASAGQQV